MIVCDAYFIFTLDSANKEILTHSRMFAPAIGVNEDPVTGMANGPLGAYLIYYNIVNHDGKAFNFKSQQGEALGRTGIIEVYVKIKNNKPEEIKIAGNAIIVFKTELEI